MMARLAVVMDPIQNIHFKKDTSLALLLEAQKRGFELFYLEQRDLIIKDGIALGNAKTLSVHDNENKWYELGEKSSFNLGDFDVILMRKDPPFDIEYIYTTYILELAEKQGALVINKAQSLRDANEKVFATWFAQCMPASLITRDPEELKKFIANHKDTVLKPLHTMGGGSIYKLNAQDVNKNVIIESLTHAGQSYIMAQEFIPDIIKGGDKRIFLINGEAVPGALARIPQNGEIRGNLAAGAKGVGVELSKRDRWICEQIGPTLRKKGLWLVGIDVIGDYLTEINVTSPTGIREINKLFSIDIAKLFFDFVANLLDSK